MSNMFMATNLIHLITEMTTLNSNTLFHCSLIIRERKIARNYAYDSNGENNISAENYNENCARFNGATPKLNVANVFDSERRVAICVSLILKVTPDSIRVMTVSYLFPNNWYLCEL